MHEKFSDVDPSLRQKSPTWGRNAAFDFLAKIMIAVLFVAVMVAMGLFSALLRYLQAPRWIDDLGLIFVVGLALGCAASFAATAHWRWKLFRFVVRNAWWPYVAAYRGIKTK